MKFLGKLILKGLTTLLPISITIYVIYWLVTSTESFLGKAIMLVLPENQYLPGMGVIAGLIILLVVGALINALAIQTFLKLGEGLLARIPLVKTIYGSVRDLMQFFSMAKERKDMKHVVVVSLTDDIQLLGFITREGGPPMLPASTDDLVAVYFPMSYQIGGYTLFLPRSKVQPIDMPLDQALRFILMAGMSTKSESKGSAT
jgi:uncharacterized membrane protein